MTFSPTRLRRIRGRQVNPSEGESSSGRRRCASWWLVWGLAVVVALLLLALGALGTKPVSTPQALWPWPVAKTVGQVALTGLLAGLLAGLFAPLLHPRTSGDGWAVPRSITALYASRAEALDTLVGLVEDPGNKSLSIVGLTGRTAGPGQALHPFWEAIRGRLEREYDAHSPSPLCVRFLMLDPKSEQGLFFDTVEDPILKKTRQADRADSIESEVTKTWRRIESDKRDIIYGDAPEAIKAADRAIQVRLYKHSPFAFMVLTESTALVQQLDYLDYSKASEPLLPVLEYRRGTEQYEELAGSYEVIWRHAKKELESNEVGTAAGIRDVGIRNIFPEHRRIVLSRREEDLLAASLSQQGRELSAAAAEEGVSEPRISILAVSGKFYGEKFRDHGPIRDSLRDGAPADIRVALANPASQQVILRAVADYVGGDLHGPRMRQEIGKWSWERHSQCSLVDDIEFTLLQLSNLNHRRASATDDTTAVRPIAVRLYSSSIACALLVTPRGTFVEPYLPLYLRDVASTRGRGVVPRRLPVFELGTSDPEGVTNEADLLEHAFEVVWESTSIGAEEYWDRKASGETRERFEGNLLAIRRELRI